MPRAFAPAPVMVAATPPVTPSVPAPTVSAEAPVLPPMPAAGDAGGLWARVAAYVADKPARRAMISQMRAVEFDGTRAVLGCPPRAVETARAQTRALAELLQVVLERPVQVTIRAFEEAEAPEGDATEQAALSAVPARTSAPSRSGPGVVRVGPDPELVAAVQDHPLVRRAADLFSARIREVRPPSGGVEA